MYHPILLTLLKMRPHDSQSSRENATSSSGISPVASYKEVPPPPTPGISDFYITRNAFCFPHKILHKLLFSNTLENR